MTSVLLYDGECGFCARSAGWALRLHCLVDATPYQSWPYLTDHGITAEAADAAVHAVIDDRVTVGHEAIAATLGTSTLSVVRLAGRIVRACSPVSARVYAWVAAHRHRLPGGTPACAIEESRR